VSTPGAYSGFMPVINPIVASPIVTGNAANGTDFGPCDDWPVMWTCDLSNITGLTPAVTGLAVSMATNWLWSATGMRFGLCSVTLRPCRRDCSSSPWPLDGWAQWPWTGSWPQPALIGGAWFNLTCGGCSGDCTCGRISEFLLPSPVASITEIKIDGVVLPSSSYRVDNNRIVVRTDGELWPFCNDLGSDDGPGTWSVTASYGETIPDGASLAVGALACEIIRGIGNDCSSVNPFIEKLVRQGVTIDYDQTTNGLWTMRTGLYLVDLFVSTWNPYGMRQKSRVYNVDRPTVRRPGTS